MHIPDERHDGQLRDQDHLLRPLRRGIVPRRLIRELGLRPGVLLRGTPRGDAIQQVESIEGRSPDDYRQAVTLYDSTPLDPEPWIRLEHNPTEFTTRVIDIFAPIGFGQRGLIVSPPRSGKTILLQNIARGIHHNYPDVKLILLLVDERPEEVTDMRRTLKAEVIASSSDRETGAALRAAQDAGSRSPSHSLIFLPMISTVT